MMGFVLIATREGPLYTVKAKGSYRFAHGDLLVLHRELVGLLALLLAHALRTALLNLIGHDLLNLLVQILVAAVRIVHPSLQPLLAGRHLIRVLIF